jgi:hypothetical protein
MPDRNVISSLSKKKKCHIMISSHVWPDGCSLNERPVGRNEHLLLLVLGAALEPLWRTIRQCAVFLLIFFVRTMRGSISTRKPNGISAHSAILRLRGRENLHITTWKVSGARCINSDSWMIVIYESFVDTRHIHVASKCLNPSAHEDVWILNFWHH